MALWQVLAALSIIIYILYRLGTRKRNYWSKKGVPHVKSYPFVGSRSNFITSKKNGLDNVRDTYNEFREHRFVGMLEFGQPVLMIRDPALVRLIAVKDFDHFVNHRRFVSESEEIFNKNLFSLKDQQWKDTRSVFSPAFTTSKMKNMFAFINKCGDQMVEHIDNLIEEQIRNNHPDKDTAKLEFKDIFTRFTNDIIATAAFGVEVDSLKNPTNEFYMTGLRVSQTSSARFIKSLFVSSIPLLNKVLKVSIFDVESIQFLRDLVKDTIKYREEKKIVRPDIIHLMMQAKMGTFQDDDEGLHSKGKLPSLTDDDIVSHCFAFFLGGFDSTSSFLSFLAYELALNEDIQQKVFEEIERVVNEDGGEVTYDGIMNKMTYLDMVCNETLRMWPQAPSTDRVVSKRYVIPATENSPEVVLEPDDIVYFPIVGFHFDPKYFPNPYKFDPERFSPENKHKITPFTFMPFGVGPRICVGMRFALMEGKACIVHLLKNFKFEVIPETPIPLKLKKGSQIAPEKGYWLGLRKRE